MCYINWELKYFLSVSGKFLSSNISRRKGCPTFTELAAGAASRHITMTDKYRDLLRVYFANNSFF